MTTPNHADRDAVELNQIYFTEAAKSINLNMVERALIEIGNKYPDATKYSFQRNRSRNEGKPVDILTEKGGEIFLAAVRHCADWLAHFGFIETQRKSFNHRHSAYGYKHQVERWIGHVKNHACGGGMCDYIPMHAFVVAAWLLGIPEQSTGGDNPVYPLSVKQLAHAEYSYKPEPWAHLSKRQREQAADCADRLAQLAQKRGRVGLFDLETLPACSWWRELSFNQRCAAVDILRQPNHSVTVSGGVGDQLALTYTATAANDPDYKEAANG